ncbi:nucleotidyl transferase AbiEii/AbiGii toxin family protein [Halomonas sp. BM-2019]|uniref:nucleotidyl transferase AbiEii/AbiGii toxin family protein n=1 Tax=Halomonas sp. BM-2019 TaxID=2811227 RepID=UPI001B3C3C30|nr:MAG: nucleotidyl transferase AbiEii/AbiGii toxin family protein [Halomonas sp. BM-2019]
MTYRRPHHQAIEVVLSHFDPVFLRDNNILFGGGTRIALELDEFRESVDIDLFCVGKAAYRAARMAVTNSSLGPLLREGHRLVPWGNREIRTDRDAIRTFLEGAERPIKLEILNFANERLQPDSRQDLFPVPCISRESCFATKLTANADRFHNHIKDILDLCMMRREWGSIPGEAWDMACEEYGERTIATALDSALRDLVSRYQAHLVHAVESLHISPDLAVELMTVVAPAWRQELARA